MLSNQPVTVHRDAAHLSPDLFFFFCQYTRVALPHTSLWNQAYGATAPTIKMLEKPIVTSMSNTYWWELQNQHKLTCTNLLKDDNLI